MNTFAVDAGLRIRERAPAETDIARPDNLEVNPELEQRMMTLLERMDFQAHPQTVRVDYSILAEPHASTKPLKPETLPKEMLEACKIRHDAFLGELAVVYGEAAGIPADIDRSEGRAMQFLRRFTLPVPLAPPVDAQPRLITT